MNKPNRLLKALLPFAPLLTAAPALAADWQVNPTIQAGGMRDDNLRLDTGPVKADVAGFFTRAELEFRGLTPVSDLRLTPSVEATYFPQSKDKDEDYTNGGLDLDWTRRGQRNFNHFFAGFQDQATVQGNRFTTDVAAGGLGNPDQGASGALTLRNRVQTLNVGDFARFDVSERNAIDVNARYEDRSFDRQVLGSDVSYSALNAALGWRHAVSERSAVTLRGTYLHYEPNLVGGTADSYGVEAEWNHQVTQRLETYARVGTVRTKFKDITVGAGDSQSSFVGGLGGNWRFQTSRLFLDYTRNIDPNSGGYSLRRDQVRVRLNKDFSERFAMLAAFRYVMDDGPQGLYTDRTYGVGTLGAQWRMRPAWSVVGTYDYSWQDYDGPIGKASSNAVRVFVVYRPLRTADGTGSSFLDR